MAASTIPPGNAASRAIRRRGTSGKDRKNLRAVRKDAGARTEAKPVPAGLVWSVLMPRPGCERMLAHDLALHDADVCMPLERVMIRSGVGNLIVVERPLFRGYVFVGAEPGRVFDYGFLETLDGMGSVMRRGREPVTLSGRVIEALNAAERSGQFDEVERAEKRRAEVGRRGRFAKGDRVVLVSGLLQGMMATVQSHKVAGRVKLLIDWDQGGCSLEVPLANVAAA